MLPEETLTERVLEIGRKFKNYLENNGFEEAIRLNKPIRFLEEAQENGEKDKRKAARTVLLLEMKFIFGIIISSHKFQTSKSKEDFHELANRSREISEELKASIITEDPEPSTVEKSGPRGEISPSHIQKLIKGVKEFLEVCESPDLQEKLESVQEIFENEKYPMRFRKIIVLKTVLGIMAEVRYLRGNPEIDKAIDKLEALTEEINEEIAAEAEI